MPSFRISAFAPIESRDGTLNKGSRSVNGYAEKLSDETMAFVKRPGLGLFSPALTTGQTQGAYYWKNLIYIVVNNSVYSLNATTAVSTLIGTIAGPIATCYFAGNLGSTQLFFHNQTNGYLINGATGALSQIENDTVVSTTLSTGGSGYSATPTVVFSAPISGVTATGTATVVDAVITNINITNGGSGYTSPPTITITDSTGVNAAATCLLNGFPAGPINPGVAYLDTYIVISLPNSSLYNCNVNNPASWSALAYVSSESEPDLSVGICKQSAFIVAFGQWSTEFFYDSGATQAQGVAASSPFVPASSYLTLVGCASGDSIVQVETSVVWIGSSRLMGKGVYMLNGTAPLKVSSSSIDRIIETSTLASISAYSVKVAGHTFYILTMYDIGITLVVDLQSQQWSQWTTYNGVSENYFAPAYSTGTNNILVDRQNGVAYSFLPTIYQDNSKAIYYRTITGNMDNGTTKRKFHSSFEAVGDKIPATLSVNYTSDDYQSFSTPRPIDLSATRSKINQCGSSFRRAWQIVSTDNKPIRLEAVEIDAAIGFVQTQADQ